MRYLKLNRSQAELLHAVQSILVTAKRVSLALDNPKLTSPATRFLEQQYCSWQGIQLLWSELPPLAWEDGGKRVTIDALYSVVRDNGDALPSASFRVMLDDCTGLWDCHCGCAGDY